MRESWGIVLPPASLALRLKRTTKSYPRKSIDAGIGAKGVIQPPQAPVPAVVQDRVGTREAEL